MIVGQAERSLDVAYKNIEELLGKVFQLEQALSKTNSILQNIRHEINYLPDSYYEWIDQVSSEIEEHLPSYGE